MTSTKWYEKIEKIRANWLGKKITVASLTKSIKTDYLGKVKKAKIRKIYKNNLGLKLAGKML